MLIAQNALCPTLISKWQAYISILIFLHSLMTFLTMMWMELETWHFGIAHLSSYASSCYFNYHHGNAFYLIFLLLISMYIVGTHQHRRDELMLFVRLIIFTVYLVRIHLTVCFVQTDRNIQRLICNFFSMFHAIISRSTFLLNATNMCVFISQWKR